MEPGGDAPVRLLLAGDVMIGRGLDQVLPGPLDPALHEAVVRDARAYVRLAEQRHGAIPAPVPPTYPWGDALATMALLAPDCRLINLETALTAAAVPWPGKGVHYRSQPRHAAVLRVAGIDLCALANNHVLDWGRAGLCETLAALGAQGIRVAGAGPDAGAAEATAVLPLPQGRRLLVTAWATASSGVPPDWGARAGLAGIALLPDLEEAGLERVRRSLLAVRRSGDRVVVALHWGANWVERLPEAHRRFAARLLEEGTADLIWGHSAHHPLPPECVAGRLVLHGCGDLINDYEGIRHPFGVPAGLQGHPALDLALLHLVSLDAGDGRLRGLRLLPFRRRRFRLERAGPRWCAAALEPLRLASLALGTRLRTLPDGGLALP